MSDDTEKKVREILDQPQAEYDKAGALVKPDEQSSPARRA
jgi:hypothetical protein